jgi:DNA-binding MarR family transcriptional regulator
MENLQCLKRHNAFHSSASSGLPRITPSQWSVLMLLEEKGEGTVKGIAQALGVTSSAATQLVEGLVKSGFVVRETSVSDRRVVALRVTKKTKSQVEKMKQTMLHKYLEVFAVLSDQEFDRYLHRNKKIVV